MILALFVLGIVLLLGGAELLVRGASRIATAAGITPLVVGLTVVAFGTSAPELAVTTAATLRGDSDLALGNVVGSNILNVLLILGLSAAVTPLLVQKRVVRLEVPFLIGITMLVVLLALDRSITRGEGILLLAIGITYTVVLVVQARRAGAGATSGGAPAGPTVPGVPIPPGDAPGTAPRTPLTLLLELGLVVVGLGLLVIGSHWIVRGAESLAASLGVPDLVIGLTVVSAGTSLPELATSVVASFRGERDMAVGNIIGSNVFNLLIILGAAAAVTPAAIGVPLSALTFDLPVMLVVTIACLPIFFTGHKIDRLEGLVFLGFYLAYTTYLVMGAAEHHALDELREAVLYFGLPLTVIVLIVAGARERESDSEAPRPD